MTEILIIGGIAVACLFSVGVVTLVAATIGDMINEYKNDKYY